MNRCPWDGTMLTGRFLQLMQVRRRLLAAIHADVIDQSVHVHGWDRNDIECALALAGSWAELERMFKDWQRSTVVQYSNAPEQGKQKGQRFYAYVLTGGLVS